MVFNCFYAQGSNLTTKNVYFVKGRLGEKMSAGKVTVYL